MIGKYIWASLTSLYKIELAGKVAEFKKSGECDGVLLWELIQESDNPTTTVGASNYKGEIEIKDLATFDNDVDKFNTWFEDTRANIIKEEGIWYNK